MSFDKKAKSSYITWGLVAFFFVLVVATASLVWGILTDDGPKKKSAIATVSLIRPPPPPIIKEKLPELPQIKQQKDEFIPETPQDQPKGADQDNTPAGDKLGLDADGKAGSDGFGLIGRKGGRSILSDGLGGGASLLQKYSWYTQIVESEVRKRVMKNLEEQGGIPRGKMQAVVKIDISDRGSVVRYEIIGSSGNHKMDNAVKKALDSIIISEAPPEGMPKTMRIRVMSQG